MPTSIRPWYGAVLLAVLGLVSLGGCTSIRGTIPASCVRPNMYDAPRSQQQPINFLRLRLDPPDVYLLGPEDVLGIYIEGVLGDPEVAPPVHFPEDKSIAPALGFPVPVREDGTVALPLVPAIAVEGRTLAQAEAEIRNAYTVKRQVLVPGRDRIIVTLMRRRTYQVLVMREDVTQGVDDPYARGAERQDTFFLGAGRRGKSYVVDLPAYENDVLHALAESGGLPGLEAKNEIVILRGGFDSATGENALLTGALRQFPEERQNRPRWQDAPAGTPVSAVSNDPARAGATVDFAVMKRLPPPQPPLMTPQALEREFVPGAFPRPDMALLTDNPGGDWGRKSSPTTMLTSAIEQIGEAPQGGLERTGVPTGEGVMPQAPAVEFFREPISRPAAPLMFDREQRPTVIRIPLRASADMPMPELTQQDITLLDGDVLFIQSRDAEVFYTGGMIQGGQHVIPRDYDLDVLGAIAMAGGTVAPSPGGAGGMIGGRGAGIFPPTRLTVVRTVNGQQIAIRTSLKKTLLDPQERILVQPNDLILLEYTEFELFMNVLMNNVNLTYSLNSLTD